MSNAALARRRLGSGPVDYSTLAAATGFDADEAVRLLALPLSEARKSAAWKDALADTPGSSELGLADTLGAPLVGTTTNGGSTATASDSAVWVVPLPGWYKPGSPISVRIRAKVTAVRGTSATVDAIVKRLADGALGSDICVTAAQARNTTSYANVDFVLNPDTIVAGDTLVVQITAAANDTATTGNGAYNIAGVWLVFG